MLSLIVLLGLTATTTSYIVEPGPKIKATVGAVWPRPKYQALSEGIFVIDPNNFEFVAIANSCDLLEQAFARYKDIIKKSTNSPIRKDFREDNAIKHDPVTQVRVNLTSACERKPYLKMDEFYYIASHGHIVAHSVWGALRALETFSQLVTPYENGLLQVPDTRINDEPRFPHRGLLVDTSRHFISVNKLLTILDGMAYNKLNVFHWHIIDDHSFPYESIKFPELSEKGAFLPHLTYSQKDIADVIEYARLRGIRVVSEFDVPGHTRSWGISHPELLTECGAPYEGSLGPINPIRNESYEFLQELMQEVGQVFPDQYIHLGGDEVGYECWQSNAAISSFVKSQNISSYSELQRRFMERVAQGVQQLQHTPIVWQEAMVEKVQLPPGTIVQVWTGNWRSLLQEFTGQGNRVLMSECWYLDHLATGGDWEAFYRCEPHDWQGTDEQKRLVVGGEACMWSESVNDNNIISRIFPRACSTAERLWSRREVTNVKNAQERLEEHTCRMISRDIAAQPPNGPGIC